MTLAKLALALLAGFVVLVLLFPGSGTGAAPPTCFSVFGYTVPCDQRWAVAAGAATTAIVGLALWLRNRRT
jgi:hypothetical protein